MEELPAQQERQARRAATTVQEAQGPQEPLTQGRLPMSQTIPSILGHFSQGPPGDTTTEGHRCHGLNQQNSLNSHTPSCGCPQMPPHQWRQQLLRSEPVVLSLWGRVHYKQIWTHLSASIQGTSRRTELLAWTAAIRWTHWLSLWISFQEHMTKARKPGC